HKQKKYRIKHLEEMPTFRIQDVEDVKRDTYNDVYMAAADAHDVIIADTEKSVEEMTQNYNEQGQQDINTNTDNRPENNEELSIVVKELENGIFSKVANTQQKSGDILEVGTPGGRFVFERDTTKERNILTIAAGSGITPVISIIQSVLENEPKSKAVLIYGNRNVEETIFYQQILALQEKYPDNFYPYFTFTRAQSDGAHFGRIDKPLINFVTKNKHKDHVFDAY